MPITCAVAATYGDYTTLPLTGNMVFYWFTPDPTFLELSPMVLKFPDYKPEEFARGVKTSESAASVVSAISSRDLEVLAPVVERFADGVDLPMSQMDAILLDHKNKGLDYSEESWRNVTCTWLRDNRAMWLNWIPDESVWLSRFWSLRFGIEAVHGRQECHEQDCVPGGLAAKQQSALKMGGNHQPRFVEWYALVGEEFIPCVMLCIPLRSFHYLGQEVLKVNLFSIICFHVCLETHRNPHWEKAQLQAVSPTNHWLNTWIFGFSR